MMINRFKIKIGWHQCTAISGTKDKGYICCTRHNWHFGKHIDYSGREIKGRRIGFHKWTNHIFDDRCIRYAQDWGYGALCMTNIFAFRSTDPHVMKRFDDPVGPDNDETLIRLAAHAGIVIAAWGVHGEHMGRGNAVRRFLHRMHVLKLTKGGHPCHPLYLKADLKPKRWE